MRARKDRSESGYGRQRGLCKTVVGCVEVAAAAGAGDEVRGMMSMGVLREKITREIVLSLSSRTNEGL